MHDNSGTASSESLYIAANAIVVQAMPNMPSAGGAQVDINDWPRWWLEIWLDAAAVFAEFIAWTGPVGMVVAVRPSMSAEETSLVDVSLFVVACSLVFVGFRWLARALANSSRGAVLLILLRQGSWGREGPVNSVAALVAEGTAG